MSITDTEDNTLAEIADQAGLRYVNDHIKGFSRQKTNDGFQYLDKKGNIISDEKILKRIKSLVIPPAWTDVWISPYANGHLQAVGRDAKGRKQYRYHTDWEKHRSENKFSKMLAFAKSLPLLRAQVEKELAKRKITKEKVIAAVILLMEKSYARIGNVAYAKQYQSYGLTTLRDRHVSIEGARIALSFVGKKGVQQDIEITDRRLAGIVKKCKDIPGYELFQYYDENGEKHTIDSGDVNAYLKAFTGEEFSAKDYRTWSGSLEALQALKNAESQDLDTKSRKKLLVETVKSVASCLGNTPSVCKKYYIHPFILEKFEEGKLSEIIGNCRILSNNYLSEDECLLIKILENCEQRIAIKISLLI